MRIRSFRRLTASAFEQEKSQSLPTMSSTSFMSLHISWHCTRCCICAVCPPVHNRFLRYQCHDYWGKRLCTGVQTAHTPETVRAEATAANLLLRRSGHRLFPAHAVDESDTAVDDATGHCANLISARKAMRLLATPRTGCRPAFLVTVRAQALASGVTDSAAVQVEVKRILECFTDVFERPSAATERPGLTSEAITVQADATSPIPMS